VPVTGGHIGRRAAVGTRETTDHLAVTEPRRPTRRTTGDQALGEVMARPLDHLHSGRVAVRPEVALDEDQPCDGLLPKALEGREERLPVGEPFHGFRSRWTVGPEDQCVLRESRRGREGRQRVADPEMEVSGMARAPARIPATQGDSRRFEGYIGPRA